jgi:hypothetical protein
MEKPRGERLRVLDPPRSAIQAAIRAIVIRNLARHPLS